MPLVHGPQQVNSELWASTTRRHSQGNSFAMDRQKKLTQLILLLPKESSPFAEPPPQTLGAGWGRRSNRRGQPDVIAGRPAPLAQHKNVFGVPTAIGGAWLRRQGVRCSAQGVGHQTLGWGPRKWTRQWHKAPPSAPHNRSSQKARRRRWRAKHALLPPRLITQVVGTTASHTGTNAGAYPSRCPPVQA